MAGGIIDLDRLDMELHSTRLLVFLETSPQSNKYHQVRLNPEQFKKFSLGLGEVVEPANERKIEVAAFQLSVEEYEIPDLQQIYEKP